MTREDQLKKDLKEACDLLHGTPILIIDRKIAHVLGEDKAVSYMDNLVVWHKRAKPFLDRMKENGN